MKIKKHCLIIAVELILFGIISVKAASTVPASGVVYGDTTVKASLDGLITKTNTGDAIADQILSGKTALVQGETVTGTMADKGAVTATIGAGTSYIIPAGYHNGSGKVTASSLSSQTSATATATQILSGKTAYVNGTKLTGTMTNRGAVRSVLTAGGSYTIPAGYHDGSGKVTAYNLASQTSATATAADIASGKTAYVNGEKITGTNTDNTEIISMLNTYPNRTATIYGNTKNILYLIIVSYADSGVSTAAKRLDISSCVGADYELLTTLRNSDTSYAANIYKLTNASNDITITTTTTSSSSTIGGNMIFLG